LIRQHNNNYNHNHKNDDARFSSNVGSRSGSVGSGSTSILQQREPDVVLKPCTEGLQFTLQLLSANRMAKVVEWQWQTLPGNCNTNNDIDNDNNNNDDNENENDNGGDNGGESGIVELDEEDIRTLFGVICGQLKDDDNDENDNDESDNDDEKKHDEKKHDDLEVTETYQGPSSEYNFAHGGLPYLESLSILGNDTGSSNHQNHHNPSFIRTLTLFLSSTHHVVGFTNLTLRCLISRKPCACIPRFEEFKCYPVGFPQNSNSTWKPCNKYCCSNNNNSSKRFIAVLVLLLLRLLLLKM